MALAVDKIDHIHVFVKDRAAAERWYADALGFQRVPALAHWADEGGPVVLGDASENVKLALFEGDPGKNRSTIAMAVGAEEFPAWQRHLEKTLSQEIKAVDHGVSWSLYFDDPDGNPFEITTYEYDVLAPILRGPKA
jgi:catechol 2,3-dioxygenase-like lactoylglutathione lyase family enzyme